MNGESSPQGPDRQRANPAVIAALTGALGAGLGGGAVATHPDKIHLVKDVIAAVKGDQSIDDMRMKIAEKFATRLSKQFEVADKTGTPDENAINTLFGEYLFEASVDQHSSAGLTPAMAVHKLELAVAAALVRGGIHKRAAERLITRLNGERALLNAGTNSYVDTLPSPQQEGHGSNGGEQYKIEDEPKPLQPDPDRQREA